jgi:hypothetical protein
MTYNLKNHPYFTSWTDPASGVESFILSERVAPIQQSFYFTNSSVSKDGQWLWIYAAFPPSPHKFLASFSLDPTRPEKHLYLQAGFSSASPMVAPEGDAAYFAMGASVYRIALDGTLTRICTLSDDYIDHRLLRRLATHLTLSADGRHFLLDGEIGSHWFVGLGDVHSGEVTIIKQFAHHFNHAQFSTTDPELFLIAQDWFYDKVSGRRFEFDHRTWLMNRADTIFRSITPDYKPHDSHDCHEWWSQDGMICYQNYAAGTYEVNVYTNEKTHVWKRPVCHAHCSGDRRYWCADQTPYRWVETGCPILFFDRQTGKEIQIISSQAPPIYPRSDYHTDPHPHFSPQGDFVIHTTTVLGGLDVALTPTAPLHRLTA